MSQAETDNITREFRKLSLPALQILLDAAKFAGNAWLAIANQPRTDEESTIYSVLTDEVERCDVIIDLVRDEAKKRNPKTIEDAEAQAYIVIGQALMGGEWEKVAQLAMPMALKHEAHMATVRQATGPAK
jgi:hypothetical protein